MKIKNWVVYFKKFDNFHLFQLIEEKLDVFNIHPIFFLFLLLISHSRTRFEHAFLKNIHQKWKYYREEKQEKHIFNTS